MPCPVACMFVRRSASRRAINFNHHQVAAGGSPTAHPKGTGSSYAITVHVSSSRP